MFCIFLKVNITNSFTLENKTLLGSAAVRRKQLMFLPAGDRRDSQKIADGCHHQPKLKQT